jgi:hypothetical protein
MGGRNICNESFQADESIVVLVLLTCRRHIGAQHFQNVDNVRLRQLLSEGDETAERMQDGFRSRLKKGVKWLKTRSCRSKN